MFYIKLDKIYFIINLVEIILFNYFYDIIFLFFKQDIDILYDSSTKLIFTYRSRNTRVEC